MKYESRTPEQVIKDERVVAEVLAFAATSKRKVIPSIRMREKFRDLGGHGWIGPRGMACCAVGAAVLFKRIPAKNRDMPHVALADALGESTAYTLGMSDGFEGVSCDESASLDRKRGARGRRRDLRSAARRRVVISPEQARAARKRFERYLEAV